MSISEKFKECCMFIKNKMLWIILIPAFLDTVNLLSWENILHTVYTPAQKLFSFKIGITGAPPSVSYLLEDFPSVLFKYDINGFSGILTRISLFNIALILTILLITSFLNSAYMGVISLNPLEKAGIKDFFINGNRLWHKFFVLNLITSIPMALMMLDRNFMFLYFVFVIFFYVQYSFVADDVGIIENFKLAMSFLFNNMGVTIKMAFVVGLAFSIFSLAAFPMLKFGTAGIIIDIFICAYLGAGANRMVFEIYAADKTDNN